MEKRWVAVTTDRNGEFQVAAGTAIESAARDRKDHKETPASILSPLRSLRSFAAIQASTALSVQNPNPWSAWIGITTGQRSTLTRRPMPKIFLPSNPTSRNCHE